MLPFLKQVAAHYLATDIRDTFFIFPNRRSAVFFRKYLSESMREAGLRTPMEAPGMLTVNDFFYRVYDVDTTDRIRLLLQLYECYKRLYPKAEPLDEFIFWGEVILGDFDDIDKCLCDPRQLLTNVADLKALQDSFSYLSDRQREAIDRFVSHFRDGSGRLTVNLSGEGVKARFLQIWNILFPLYEDFKSALSAQGMAYEGMVYRDLAERLQGGDSVADILSVPFPGTRRFVFVGLNALNPCERRVLGKMRDAGLAEFCWDYVSEMVTHPLNKSSLFLREQVVTFPQAFPIDPDGLKMPQFQVISVPSSVGQAKLAPWILSQTRGGDLVETAFVLPDEQLLVPLLNSIPPEVDRINVTMGYPMTLGSVYSFLSGAAALQMHLRCKDGTWLYYHRNVHSLLRSSLLQRVLTPEEKEVVKAVLKAARYYIPEEDLRGGPMLELLFRPIITSSKEASAATNHALEDYLRELISYIGSRLKEDAEMALELDLAKRSLMALNVLRDIDLEVLPGTFLRLVDNLLSGISVPFQGEPLQGLQIMGPLETRALDFRHLVILSAGEGLFPRRSISSSFIPPELRKGFGLPTYEDQDAVWAYYFYRMIQRAETVTLVYDSRTEGLKTGEESRYIKQLQYHFRVPLKRFVVTAPMQVAPGEDAIPKTEADVAVIRERELSATTLQSYLSCQAQFYYKAVQKLSVEDEVSESMDAGMIGSVYHAAMQGLYGHRKMVTSADIGAMLKDTEGLRKRIRGLMMEQMKTIEVTGRNLVVEEVILEYVRRTLRYDRGLLLQSGSPGFRILGLEREMHCDFEGFHLKGFIDRMDSYLDGEVRIVDYKTGKVEDTDINITDENAADVVEKLFGESNTGRPKIALQLFVYDMFAHTDPALSGQRMVNSIYSVPHLFTQPMQDRPQNAAFARGVRERLREMLAQMTDISVPFRRTDDLTTCSYCDFKMICGR